MGLILKILKFLFIALVSFLLTVSLVVFATGFSAKEVVLSTQTYTTLLDKSNAYELFQSQIKAIFKQSFSSQSSLFTDAELEQFAREAFTKQWFDSQTKNLLENFFGYLNGKKNSLQLSVSLVEPKQKIAPFLEKKLSQLSGGQQLPADSNILESLNSQIPNAVDLAEKIAPYKKQLDSAKEIIGYFSTALIALIVLIVLLAGLIFLVLRNRKAFFLCFQCLLASAVSVFIFPIILASKLQSEVFQKLPKDQLSMAVQKTVLDFIGLFSEKMNFFAKAYLVIAIIFLGLFLFFLIKSKKQKTAEQKPADVKQVEQKQVDAKPVEIKREVKK